MRIKKLEVIGFKSFAQRAQLVFGDGITGVVGPNGCGKSNVVDAIRWCMGEMSAKHLRGRAMQDVIFAGSDSQGPAGLAEVTLTFDNTAPPQPAALPEVSEASTPAEDGASCAGDEDAGEAPAEDADVGEETDAVEETDAAPPAVAAAPSAAPPAPQASEAAAPPISGDVRQFLQYAEISVTRRLHRDGTSDYLLNKLPVRLRDVTDLFLGTGVGTRAYSIIEQGRIGFVVNARPEDRRGLIEEVAGITKFKVRKRTAERRMEATTQNLQRVDDIIAELERQLHSLRRQAKVARRYQELRAEQRQLELHAASLEYLRLYVLEQVQRRQRLAAEQQLESSKVQAADGEAALQHNRQALQAAQASVEAASQEAFAAESGRQALLTDLAHWQEQAQRCAEQAEQAAAAQKALQQRLGELQADGAQLAAEATRLREAHEGGAAALAEAGAAASAAAATLQEAEATLAATRRAAMAQVQHAAQERSLADGLAQQHERGVAARQRAKDDHAKQREEAAAQQARHAELTARQAQLADELAAAQAQHAALVTERDALATQRDASRAALEGLQRQHTQRQSRLQSLQQIAARLDGYSDGVRALLGGGKAKKGGAAAPFVLPSGGLVAELLDVPSAYEPAIEAVLGDRLQFIWVEDAATAQAAIDYLKEQRSGRSGFMVAPAVAAAATAAGTRGHKGGLPQQPGILGWALDHVDAAPQHAALLDVLLGDVVLVDSLAHGLAAAADHPELSFVSTAGEVVERSGAVSGGSANGAGLLAHRREMRELGRQVEALGQQLAEAEAACRAQQQRHAELQAALRDADQAARALELQRLGAAKDCQAAAATLKQLATAMAAQQARAAQQEEELQRLAAARAAALAKATASGDAQARLDVELGQQQAAVEASASELMRHQEAVTTLKVQRAAEAQQAAAAQAAAARVASQLDEARQRLADLEAEQQRAVAAADELGDRLHGGDADRSAWDDKVAASSAALRTARQQLAEASEQSASQEAAMLARRQDEGSLHAAHLACSTEQQRLQLEMGQLEARLRERYDLCLSQELGDYHDLALPTPTQQQRQRDIEAQIKRMGPINLTAIDECATLETRHGFLTGQRDDLHAALEALRRAIGQMNRASRERFTAAFGAVNAMFEKVYPRLFRGGTARLEMVGGDDALEAGIDIVAMPPGKKLQNVSLLSGGEKALTATALIFSIFLIKPSPFCILDEVDAPLDEANVERFNELLREISAVSQFILITHNKQTMLQADRLYGITMEEPGMSKVVSVDLQRHDGSQHDDGEQAA